jgi:hypothetical protein
MYVCMYDGQGRGVSEWGVVMDIDRYYMGGGRAARLWTERG